jgi:AAA domain
MQAFKAINARRNLLIIGEAGSGKTAFANKLKEHFPKAALVHYVESSQFIIDLATELNIDTENEKGNPVSAKILKSEMLLNCHKEILIIDDAQRLSAGLRYWLESFLIKSESICILLAIDNPRKDLFLKCTELELSPPSDADIREAMMREAVHRNIRLSPGRLSQLQAKAGKNLMLARKLVQEESLGLSPDTGEHSQYFDISPFVAAALCALGVVRFIGLGLGDRTLYIIGGVAMLVGLSLKYLGQGMSRRSRRLGR